jgi:hypothetical protein
MENMTWIWPAVTFLLMLLSGGITYIVTIALNKEKIGVLMEAVFPKDRGQQLIRRGDCFEAQEHCQKVRLLELKNICATLSELTKRFDNFQEEVVRAIKKK